MKTRNIIEIDKERCNGCGLCVTGCAEGAIAIIDGKATIISDTYCDGLGACLAVCPQDALHIIQRAAAPFDEAAAEQHMKKQQAGTSPDKPVTGAGAFAHSLFTTDEPLACGCSSATVKQFHTPDATPGAPFVAASCVQPSGPGHWPLKIRLVPTLAPFLKNAHILVAADCAAASSPCFHQLAAGKVVLIGCPKFEDTQALSQRLADMFAVNTIQSLTLLRMEVPCCQGLASVCREAITLSGKDIPITEKIMNCDGTLRA